MEEVMFKKLSAALAVAVLAVGSFAHAQETGTTTGELPRVYLVQSSLFTFIFLKR